MKKLKHLDYTLSPQPNLQLQWPACPTPHPYPKTCFISEPPPKPNFCQIRPTGLDAWVSHWLYYLNCCKTFLEESPILSSQSFQSTYPRRWWPSAYGRPTGYFTHRTCSLQPTGLGTQGRNTGRWRIVDLSHPANSNEIPKPNCSLKYPSVDDAVQFIRRLGLGILLLKVDLRSVYHMVPVHLLDCHLLGICWKDRVYVDQALPFGLCSAPCLFTAVADAIGWAMCAGIILQIHYLDDFLFFLPWCPGQKHCCCHVSFTS